MAFLNLFKKGKKEEKRERKQKPAVKPAQVKVAPPKKKQPSKPEIEAKAKKAPAAATTAKKTLAEEKKPVRRKGIPKVTPRILKGPQITEKARDLEDQNDYVFKVADNATKPEIKKAVEEVYGVQAEGVRTIKVPGKTKRLGRTKGFKPGYKKAIVRLKKGQTIEILPR